jgi:PAS domain S-box-containing protein
MKPDRLVEKAFVLGSTTAVVIVFTLAGLVDQYWLPDPLHPARQLVHWIQGGAVVFLLERCLDLFLFQKWRTQAEENRRAALRQALTEDALQKCEQVVQQERQRAAELLGTNVDQFRALLEQSADGLAVLAADGAFRSLGPSLPRLLGYATHELLGRNLFDLVHSEDYGTVQDLLAHCMNKPAVDIPALFRFQHKDGSWRYLDCIGNNRLQDPAVAAVVVHYRVSVERYPAQAGLSDRDWQLQILRERAPLLVVSLNRNGRIESVNRQVLKVTDYDPEDLLGAEALVLFRPPRSEGGGPPPSPEVFLQELQTAGEKILYTKEGKERIVVWTHMSRRDQEGAFLDCLSIGEDITDRRNLEDQLRQAQKMEVIARLASGVAHDLNNLLTVIQGHADFLKQALPPSDPLAQNLELIQRAVDRTATLTQQLLSLSRKQESASQVIDLNAIVRDMEKMLQPLMGKGIEVLTILAPELGAVRADPAQIEQIILNLAVNARDAMPGGGQLIIQTANAELDKAYARQHPDVQPGPYALLAVSDTGSGMTEEVQSHIFEPLFSTKKPGKGSGLGLSTVLGIVKQSSGHIKVFSIPGQGSTFRIYLPRLPKAVESAAPGYTAS